MGRIHEPLLPPSPSPSQTQREKENVIHVLTTSNSQRTLRFSSPRKAASYLRGANYKERFLNSLFEVSTFHNLKNNTSLHSGRGFSGSGKRLGYKVKGESPRGEIPNPIKARVGVSYRTA